MYNVDEQKFYLKIVYSLDMDSVSVKVNNVHHSTI